MKRQLLSVLFISLLIIGLSTKGKSQTPGTLTFTYTQVAPSGSATKNVMAVWIEDSATGAFIKTKMRYWSGSTSDHLPSWATKSGQSVVDASTGATRTASTSPTAFGAKTITWNGTNASGTVVPDGVYRVFVESSYCNPEPASGTHWIITSFPFTKSSSITHSAPTGPTNFSAITLDWVPVTTPVVTTGTTSNITLTSANCAGNVVSDAGFTITDRGICCDTLANPDTTKYRMASMGTLGAFSCSLTGLISNKTYHYRAYAKNASGISWGADSSFKTLCVKPTTPVITQSGNTLTSNAPLGNQWCNTTSGIIGSATATTYIPAANGTYYVIVVINGCSSDSSNNIHYSTVGVDVYENNKTIKVYPNPVSNELVIEINGNTIKQQFEIYNSIGQQVYKGELIDKTTVQTTNFAPGVYMIKLENGKTYEFKKIIKE